MSLALVSLTFFSSVSILWQTTTPGNPKGLARVYFPIWRVIRRNLEERGETSEGRQHSGGMSLGITSHVARGRGDITEVH